MKILIKVSALKQQIISQQDSIVSLKRSLLKAKQSNMYCMQMVLMKWKRMMFNPCKYILKGLLMSQKMIYITINSESWLIGEAWLEQLVDDVVQKYDVMHFKIAPIWIVQHIIVCDEDKIKKNTDKYPQKLLKKKTHENCIWYK